MKKTIALIVSAAAYICATAAAGTPIQNLAAEAQGKCPVDMGSGIVLKSVTVDEEPLAITYTYAVDPQQVNFKGLKSRSAMLKNTKAVELTTDPESQTLRETCVSNGASIAYVYTCGNDSFTILLTPDDIK